MISTAELIRSPQAALENTRQAGRADDISKVKQPDSNDLAKKEVFLQLLIAQIKNQDPTKPGDSIQYITQLSQFTGVEQLVDIKTQLRDLITKLTPATPEKPAAQLGSE